MEGSNAKESKTKGLTPYQGKKRCFGKYKCTKCSREWASANSWANMGQKCRECLTNVYAHAQWPIKKRKKTSASGENKAHLEDLCEKCENLGRSCRSFHRKVQVKII